jgi:23S rRNA pseudouridine2605 synthase
MKNNPDQGRRGGARKGSAGRRGGSSAKPSPGRGAGRPSSKSQSKSPSKPGAKPSFKSDSKPTGRPQGGPSNRPGGRTGGRFGAEKPKLKFAPVPDSTASMRLNRYIAQAGICSRREADVMIGAGAVTVNNKVVTELGFKVDPTKDLVRVEGDTIRPETMRYVLVNKPKNFLGVEHDPSGRRSIGDLIKNACKERVFPVDRIEKESTGLILFTNDGELTKRLNHPKVALRELYHITLAKKASPEDLEKLRAGFVLDQGYVKAKEVEFVKNDPHEIGMEIHSNRSRIARRMWEHLGHKVVKVDRVVYGPLTKKDLPRGHWRHLTQDELNMLRMTT